MKICFFASIFSIHTQRWVHYFSARGHAVSLITFPPEALKEKEIYSRAVDESLMRGVDVHYLKPMLGEKGKFLANVVPAKKVLRHIRPDVVIGYRILSYGFLAAYSGFRPLVLATSGSDILIDPERSMVARVVARKSLHRADRVLSWAAHAVPKLEALGVPREKIIVLPRGVDTGVFKPGMKAAGAGMTVITIRGFLPVYNQGFLIDAIPLVLKEDGNIRFVFAGDGYLRARMEERVAALNVKERVEFLGEVKPQEVPGLLSRADIYVSTSLSDLTSVSLLEALACGLFPVVTDIPANREWIRDGQNGFLVPPGQPQVLAQRILTAAGDRTLREKASEMNAGLISERGSWNTNMGKMEALCGSLVQRIREEAKCYENSPG